MFEVVEINMMKLNRDKDKIINICNSNWFKYGLVFLTMLLSSSIELVTDIEIINMGKNAFFIIVPLILIVLMIKNKQINKDINITFLLLCVFSFISVIWSISPKDTIKGSILLVGTTILAMYISKNYEKEEIMKSLLIWFFALVVINLVLVVFKFDIIYQIEETRYNNAIKGIFKHRNTLGLYMSMAIGVGLWFILQNKEKVNKYIPIATVICGGILLYLSKSMTSLLLGILIIFLIYFTRYKKFNTILCYSIIPLMIVGVLVLVFTPNWFKEILESLGRNSTLTGRSVIWAGVIAAIVYKPLLGYGFGAFWTVNPHSVLFVLSEYKYELPVNSHNGYLDLLIEFGVVGVIAIIIWIAYMVKKLKETTKVNLNKNNKYIGYIMSYFIFILVFNLVESSLMKPCNSSYILLVVFTNMLSRISKESI